MYSDYQREILLKKITFAIKVGSCVKGYYFVWEISLYFPIYVLFTKKSHPTKRCAAKKTNNIRKMYCYLNWVI